MIKKDSNTTSIAKVDSVMEQVLILGILEDLVMEECKSI
jgi:hypothetical protein